MDVSICVRLRPHLQNEHEKGLGRCIGIGTFKSRKFGIDTLFSETNSSDQVYVETAQTLIPFALASGVGNLFANGQTGSGKTFTMTDIVRHVAHDIFKLAAEYRTLDSTLASSRATDTNPYDDFTIQLSFFELFGNTAADLLNDRVPITIVEDALGSIQVRNVTEETVTSAEDFLALIERGATLRRTVGTANNDASSRSHSVCRIRVINRRMPELPDGFLYLVDLAGSGSNSDQCRTIVIANVSSKVTPTIKPPPPSRNDPATGTNADLRQWVETLPPCCRVDPEFLCPIESGAQLYRLPEGVFLNRCLLTPTMTPKLAKAVYLKLWDLLMAARSAKRVRVTVKASDIWGDAKATTQAEAEPEEASAPLETNYEPLMWARYHRGDAPYYIAFLLRSVREEGGWEVAEAYNIPDLNAWELRMDKRAMVRFDQLAGSLPCAFDATPRTEVRSRQRSLVHALSPPGQIVSSKRASREPPRGQ
ncbi:P-loop containing nucleoside triphosphate hydrolase protein, partial [Blyttiomyces helicus]